MNEIWTPTRILVDAAGIVADGARANATALDEDDAFPAEDVQALAAHDLLTAPLPRSHGGVGLGLNCEMAEATARVLTMIGSGSLPLGRLYEGHVNALKFICTHGEPRQVTHFADIVRKGLLLAVWNTEAKDGVRLRGVGASRRLEGRKIFASGAGHITHPLITAHDDHGNLFMVVPEVDDPARADGSAWRPHGMRASASGAVDFTGLPVAEVQIIGNADDFHAQPSFSTGAWRFAAVQAGGIAALFDAARAHLVKTGRANDPHQRARMGTAAMAVQTALQWIVGAAKLADDDTIDGDARIAHVNLARSAVERAGLDVLELAHRSVGLQGFMRGHPLERMSRDLATYLRQPNPDKALTDAASYVLASPSSALDMWPWH